MWPPAIAFGNGGGNRHAEVVNWKPLLSTNVNIFAIHPILAVFVLMQTADPLRGEPARRNELPRASTLIRREFSRIDAEHFMENG